jgi:hypothetical protein
VGLGEEIAPPSDQWRHIHQLVKDFKAISKIIECPKFTGFQIVAFQGVGKK